MKKTNPRLKFKALTIRDLSTRELVGARGGVIHEDSGSGYYYTGDCNRASDACAYSWGGPSNTCI
jgi:hypothetical protein